MRYSTWYRISTEFTAVRHRCCPSCTSLGRYLTSQKALGASITKSPLGAFKTNKAEAVARSILALSGSFFNERKNEKILALS